MLKNKRTLSMIFAFFLYLSPIYPQDTNIKISHFRPFINAGLSLSSEAMKGLLPIIEFGIPIKLQELDSVEIERIGKGSYIANVVSGCYGCHTSPRYAPGGDPFKGEPKKINIKNYMAGGRQFRTSDGAFRISTNLTPDPSTRNPGKLTEEKFINIMRTGKGVDGRILQSMPWPEYSEMTDADLKAIYSFLKAIPHAEPAPQPPAR